MSSSFSKKSLFIALPLILIFSTSCSKKDESPSAPSSRKKTQKSNKTLPQFNGLNEIKIEIDNDFEQELSDLIAEQNELKLLDLKSNDSKINFNNSYYLRLEENIDQKETEIQRLNDEVLKMKEKESKQFSKVEKLKKQIKDILPCCTKEKEQLVALIQKKRKLDKKREQNQKLDINKYIIIEEILSSYGQKKNNIGVNSVIAPIEDKIEALSKNIKNKEGTLKTKKANLEAALFQEVQKLQKYQMNLDSLNNKIKTSKYEITLIQEKIKTIEQENINRSNTLKSEVDNSPTISSLSLKLEIAKKLKAKKEITPKEITEALITLHNESPTLTNSQKPYEEINGNLRSILSDFKAGDINEFKQNYEKSLAINFHQAKELIYNREYTTLVDPIYNNRMQCYSGTMFFLIMNELLEKNMYKNIVVIFIEGHILPGYIAVKENEFNLFGIETTSKGKGIINFGKTSNIQGDIRVFDAHQFMLVELLKDHIKNKKEIFEQMFNTMKKYDFKPKNFKPFDESDSSKNYSSDQQNSTFLAFGESNTEYGDLKRPKFDTKENLTFQKKKGKEEERKSIIVEKKIVKQSKDVIGECKNFPKDEFSYQELSFQFDKYCKAERNLVPLSFYLNESTEESILGKCGDIRNYFSFEELMSTDLSNQYCIDQDNDYIHITQITQSVALGDCNKINRQWILSLQEKDLSLWQCMMTNQESEEFNQYPEQLTLQQFINSTSH